MKLLRFSSIDNEGIFTNTLDQELIIPPKSKLALGSCALELDPDKLVIDASNDSVNVAIQDNASLRTFKLRHTDGTGDLEFYDNNNFQLFFNDFTAKCNGVIGSSFDVSNQIAFASEIGKQALIKKDRNGKIEIKLNSSVSANYGDEVDNNTPLKTLDGVQKKPVIFSDGSNSLMVANTNTAQGNNSYLCSTIQTYPIAKGCGIHRARFDRCNNIGATATRGGVSISLHRINPSTYIHTRNILANDISFGIQAQASFDAGGNLQGNYFSVIDGVFADSGIAITSNDNTNGNNDYLSIEVVGSFVRGVVYKNNGGAIQVNVIFNQPYNSIEDLYASYTIHGAGIIGANRGARLRDCRYTPDPYLQEANPNFNINRPHDPVELGASTPRGQAGNNSLHHIEFEGQEVNEYLGFNNNRLPLLGGLRGKRQVIFTGENTFKSGIINDCFMIEMLNLKLESYDFHETQRKRKNLLAVLPFDDDNNKLIFQPSNLVFLDLSNKAEIKTSEIKLRIIRADYSPVQLTGLSSVVIYLDN